MCHIMNSVHGPPTLKREKDIFRMRFGCALIMLGLTCMIFWLHVSGFVYGNEFASLMLLVLLTVIGLYWALLEDEIGKPHKWDDWLDPYSAIIVRNLVRSLQLLWIFYGAPS